MALQEFAAGNNLFSADLYKNMLVNAEENFLVSPFAAEVILALTESGAKNETAQEILNSLHLPKEARNVQSAMKAVLSSLKGSNYGWHAANTIYLPSASTVNEEFETAASQVYETRVENRNVKTPSRAASVINDWVKKQTSSKFKNLMDSKDLDTNTIILINAVYFHGEWKNPFDSYYEKSDFYKSARDVIQVDIIGRTENYNYFESEELKAEFLEIPFKGTDASMVIVLPNEKEGLADLESQIEKVFSSHKFSKVGRRLLLPKFKIDTKVNLKEILQELGIDKAFTADADFSGIVENSAGLCISKVVHKTFIDVSEKGVEAAAAPAAEMKEYATASCSPSFDVNHPFIFYIKIKDVSIFAGRVKCPNY